MAIANRYTGKDLYAEFICSSGVIPLTGDQTMFSVTKQVDLFEVTPGDADEREYASNIKDGEIEVDLLDVGSAAALAIDTVLDVGVIGTLVYAPKGTSAYYTNPKRGFPVVVQGKSFDYPYDEVCEVNLSFKKIGSAIWGGTATWNYSDEAILYLKQDGNANNSALRASGGVGVQPTINSNVIYPTYIVPQVGTAAGQYAETTLNYVENPSFENNVTDYWSVNNVVATQDATDAKVGSACVLLTGNDGATDDNHLNRSVTDFTDGDTVTFSVYGKVDSMYTPADSRGLKLVVYEYDGNDYNNNAVSSAIDAEGEWQFKSVTLTARSGHQNFLVRLYVGDRRSSVSVKWDAVQIEKKSYPTPYCDGSLGTGHSWAGTAHNSKSSRNITALVYDNIMDVSASDLTFSLWLRMVDVDNNTGLPYIVHFGEQSTGRIFILQDDVGTFASAGGVAAGFVKTSATTWDANSGASVLSDRTWHHLAVVCVDLDTASPDMTLYLDTTPVGSVTGDYAIPNLNTEELWLGRYETTGFELNGFIDEFLVFDRALSATEVTAIYNRGAAGNPA